MKKDFYDYDVELVHKELSEYFGISKALRAKVFYKNKDLEASILYLPDEVYLFTLIVKKKLSGTGTKFMQTFTKTLDEAGALSALSAMPLISDFDEKTLNESKLKSWYRKYGYKTIRNEFLMRRFPNKKD